MMTSSAADRGLPAAPLLIAAVALLTFLTLLHFHGTPRFETDGAAAVYLANDPRLLSGAGTVNADIGAPDRLEITHALGDAPFVRISAVLASQDIVLGARRWQQGRLIAVQRYANGHPRYDLPHVVARLHGDQAKRARTSTFRVERGSKDLLLRAEVLGTTGFLQVAYLKVQPLVGRPGFAAGSAFIISCWALLGVAISYLVLLSLLRRRFRAAMAYAVAAPALLLSVLPATATTSLRLGVARRVDLAGAPDASARVTEAALSTNLFSIAKAGHVVMFAAVGFVFALTLARGRTAMALSLALGFGLVAEMLQLFSPNRTASLFDVGLNLGSAAGGVFIAVCAVHFWNRLIRSPQPPA